MDNIFSHKKNKKIIVAMLSIAAIALLLFLTACTASKIDRNKEKRKEEIVVSKLEKQQETRTIFDFSVINQEDMELTFSPIDASKEMIVGNQTFKNATPIYRKIKTKEEKNIKTTNVARKTERTDEKKKAATTEINLEKRKFSVPWYAFFFIGLFTFLIIVAIYFLKKIANKFKPFI